MVSLIQKRMKVFLGYSQSSKAYRVYNKRLQIVEESVHVSFDESCPKLVGKGILFDGAGVSSESILKDPVDKSDENKDSLIPEKIEEKSDQVPEVKVEDQQSDESNLPLEWKSSKDHPIDNILGDISKGVTTRSKISNFCYHFAFVSQIEPKNSKDALLD